MISCAMWTLARPAAAGVAEVERDLVAGDAAAPVALEQQVVERGAAGLHAVPRQRLARHRVEHVRDHPRLHVIAALFAGPVEALISDMP